MSISNGYCGMPLPFISTKVDVDGRYCENTLHGDVKLLGKASLQPDGKWRCLANVAGSLCLVQVSLRFEEGHD